ncbi:MAG: SDR family NAD(P)-dependent oxidoreductase [Lachnospiraceae bacterium]|nr:SDR family NAD(P)-dependent oxidoreductase [Lachnospiraceae bacterium]
MKKNAFITGASRGIGKAIATTLAKEGYNLYLTCHKNDSLLSTLMTELEEAYSISCTGFVGDISDYAFVSKCFSNIEHLDVLINNAGISHVGLFQYMTPDEWNRVISVNLTSAFYTSKLAVANMLKTQSGKILNISSVWGNAGASTEVAYSASKGGLNSFTKALAKELAPSNIQVNAIACGMIDTDMNNCFSAEEKNVITEDIPVGRMGTAAEVAELALNIIKSPAYLTGQIITLDGGWL